MCIYAYPIYVYLLFVIYVYLYLCMPYIFGISVFVSMQTVYMRTCIPYICSYVSQAQTPSQAWAAPAPVTREATSARAVAPASTVVTVSGDAKLPGGDEQHKGDEHDKLNGGDEKRCVKRALKQSKEPCKRALLESSELL